ncbi:hypothetical protein KIS1582_5150 [Cytobacillus firmus]|uniref:Uncharacterized protein n=1 Tax=Cytobacillus firmus TaxID=1399 RepID=A0A800N847_CYTFI|nr:hypothetical protein KIS1582_5150 [Cytobacillus firmus]
MGHITRCWTWASLYWIVSGAPHSERYRYVTIAVLMQGLPTPLGELNPHEKPMLSHNEHKKAP